MARKRIASRHGERAAILHLLVVAPEEFNGIDSHDHLVSRIRLPGNVGPTFLPRASQWLSIAAQHWFDHLLQDWQAREPTNSGAGSV